MKLVYDYLTNAVLRYKASNNFLRTTNTVAIQGWCEVEKNEELQKICLVSVGEWTVSTICIHFAESVLVSIIISLLVVLPSILNEGNKEIQSLLSEGEL